MNTETVVEKIRKLLRLARGNANENEAASAMAMAQRLMLQHDITNVEEKVEELAIRGEWKDFDGDKKWQLLLCTAAAKLYNCRCVTMGKKKVQFIGKPSNVLVAADTLQWIIEQVAELHKQALVGFRAKMGGKLEKFHYRDFRLTFKEACALRIYHRCEEIVATMRNEIPAHMALVVIDQALAAADDLLREDNVGPGKAMKMRRSGFGTGAGMVAGNQVKLQHNVSAAAKPVALLK
jgi:hypothetical protein